mmetsp:Transcript_46342/g.110336  ORF Transcript_46342/g.110336 Transcript_46342/m.110336 type:complete len:312 (+) Transcript_46342:79-1014(+)
MVLLTAERHALLSKTSGQITIIREVVVCAIVSIVTFYIVFWCSSFQYRFENKYMSMVFGPFLFLLLTIILAIYTQWWQKRGYRIRMYLNCIVLMLVATIAGYFLGDWNFWRTTAPYYTYMNMATYVNIDTGLDKGGAFMDAGRVFFKESTYVARNRALAFRNGDRYCIAPIIREPLLNQDGTNQLQTYSYWVLPKSGSVDWWAVGKNCCGEDGSDFKCGEVDSALARSGLRLLNDQERDNYLVAVEEWVGTTGLPSHHPLFFTWTKDPVASVRRLHLDAWNMFWLMLLLYSIATAFMLFFLYLLCQKFRIY